MLYLHLGLVWLLLALQPFLRRSTLTSVLIGIGGSILILSNLSTAAAPRIKEIKEREQNGRMLASVEMIKSHIPANSIAFASESVVFPYQASGRRVVSIPRPEPVAPSLPERQAATDRFFAKNTTQSERLALIARWQATHVVFNPEDISTTVAKDLRKLGSAKKFPRDFEIITFSNTGTTS